MHDHPRRDQAIAAALAALAGYVDAIGFIASGSAGAFPSTDPGDKLIDLECGWNAGVKQSLLVRTGYGAAVEQKGGTRQAPIVDDLPAATDRILNSYQS